MCIFLNCFSVYDFGETNRKKIRKKKSFDRMWVHRQLQNQKLRFCCGQNTIELFLVLILCVLFVKLFLGSLAAIASSSIASKYCRQKRSVDYYKATTICMTTISQHQNNTAESINDFRNKHSSFNWGYFDYHGLDPPARRRRKNSYRFWLMMRCWVQRYVRPWTIRVCGQFNGELSKKSNNSTDCEN